MLLFSTNSSCPATHVHHHLLQHHHRRRHVHAAAAGAAAAAATTTISTIAITAATKKSTSTTAMETATLHEIELQPFQQKTMRIEYWPLAVDASHVQRIEPYSTLAVDVRQETAYYTSP